MTPFRAIHVGFRDLLIALAVFFIVIALVFMHPPKSASNDQQSGNSIVVSIFWPDNVDDDVDLWVKAPTDRPVGYSNSHGLVFDLVHDCLGFANNVEHKNYEIALTRGIPDGEYDVNVHFYNGKVMPVNVKVVVKIRNQDGETLLWTRDVILNFPNEEITVGRFKMDRGHYLSNTLSTIPVGLREAKK